MTTQTTETKKPSKGKKFLLLLTLLVVLIAFGGVVGMQQFIASKKAEAAANMPESISEVTAMTVETSEWTPKISAVGSIRPNQGAMISAQANGTVTKIHVKSGDRVTKGQLLVEVDSAAERANLRASEAQLPNAQANYNRMRNLVASNSASKAELDSAKATYDNLVASIEATKAEINRRQIYAPFSGTAGIVRVNEGEYVTSGTQMVRVEDQSQMKIRFTLPQTNVEDIFIGQKVTATVDALPGQTFPARIVAIDPAVDSTTGLINLEAVVEEGQDKLLSGMFVRLNVAKPTLQGQVVVPQITVAYSMYGETAYVLQPLTEEETAMVEKMGQDASKVFRAKQVEVKTLERSGIYSHLEKGLKVGDRIVTSGFQRLSNNALVSVKEGDPVGLTAPANPGKL